MIPPFAYLFLQVENAKCIAQDVKLKLRHQIRNPCPTAFITLSICTSKGDELHLPCPKAYFRSRTTNLYPLE